MRRYESDEAGFTILEVALASVITMVGLAFLAGLFTLGIAQNRMVKQYTTATSLAQQKLEELNAIERTDARLAVGGGLNTSTADAAANNYNDTVYVDPSTGIVTNVIPQGATPIYDRYWKVEADSQLGTTFIISVRVVARQPSVGRTAEQTTLTTARSW
jgi:Tfp pilus assembly protein PilV